MARTFLGYASEYSADQVQQCRVRRYQKRKLRVNFNGLLPKGEQLDQIIWDTDGPWVTRMSDAAPSPDGRTAELVVRFNYWGTCSIRCQVLSSGGDVYNYQFFFRVTNSPIMPADTYDAPTGPFRVVWDRPEPT